MITRAEPRTAAAGPRLASRVFWAMVLVVLAGAGTLIAVSLMLAPAVFHRHLDQAGVLGESNVAVHVEEAFAVAALASTGAGVLAALAVAGAGSALVARRLTDPIAMTARAAGRLAAGDYAARVEQPRMGPELAALADSVNALAQRLEDIERSRIQLMADLAHELRTPVASIEATVEAVADRVLPADDQTLATLTDQSRRLSRLIDDLALVSRAEERSFSLTISTVNAVDLGRAAALGAAAGFTRGGVQLDAPEGPPVKVLADPDRVGEALDQLLANSLHHCQPGDRVSIAVSRHGLSAELAVTDTGSGFDPADAEKLFQRFYRADPALANPTGSGIGLTVARALIQAQGGTLTARSPGKGAGATFTIGLPASEG
jgi:signal transduction histidine kinase